MKLKEYIEKGSILVVSETIKKEVEGIKGLESKVYSLDYIEEKFPCLVGVKYILVDSYYRDRECIERLERIVKCEVVYFHFTNKVLEELRESYSVEPILIEIKLKELGEVPEVYYKGELIESKVDICFDWKTISEEPGHTKLSVRFIDREGEIKMVEHVFIKD